MLQDYTHLLAANDASGEVSSLAAQRDARPNSRRAPAPAAAEAITTRSATVRSPLLPLLSCRSALLTAPPGPAPASQPLQLLWLSPSLLLLPLSLLLVLWLALLLSDQSTPVFQDRSAAPDRPVLCPYA